MAEFERGVVQATQEWRDRNRGIQDDLKEGLDTGSFAGTDTDPYQAPDTDPDTAPLEESLLQAMKAPANGASRGFSISHHTQLAFLEAHKRTGAVRRISRRGALALLRNELEDGRRRDDQLETLIVLDDAPEGVSEDNS